jgi:deazaflavin-dependent oxidoreductase (nitroreductase family)
MNDRNAYNRQLIEEFREHRGNPTGPMAGRPLLLLTTTGAKSGQPRIAPLMYVSEGERLLIIASNAGAPRHPDWYHNLVAHPQVTVEVGTETYTAIATVITAEERERLWASLLEQYPFFADHQAGVARQIPIVALERQ